MDWKEFFMLRLSKVIIFIMLVIMIFASQYIMLLYSCSGLGGPICDSEPIQYFLARGVVEVLAMPVFFLDRIIPQISHKYIWHNVVSIFLILIEIIYLYTISCLISSIRIKK